MTCWKWKPERIAKTEEECQERITSEKKRLKI